MKITDKNDTKDVVGWGFFVVVALFGVPYGWWSSAYVLTRVWNWYRPDFVPALPLKAALGATFIVGMLTFHLATKHRQEKQDRGGRKQTLAESWIDLVVLAVVPWAFLLAARTCLWMFYE